MDPGFPSSAHPCTCLREALNTSILVNMPLISRLFVIVRLPERESVATYVWGLAFMVGGWGTTRIAGVILALAMPTLAKCALFGLDIAPLVGGTAVYLTHCYAIARENLKRAAQ